MEARTIIEKLGDTAEVAAALNVPMPAVSNWKARGLPRGRLLELSELATSKGLGDEITSDVIKSAVALPRPSGRPTRESEAA